MNGFLNRVLLVEVQLTENLNEFVVVDFLKNLNGYLDKGMLDDPECINDLNCADETPWDLLDKNKSIEARVIFHLTRKFQDSKLLKLNPFSPGLTWRKSSMP